MTPEEQAILDTATNTARTATRDLAIVRAVGAHAWVMTGDAERALADRASHAEDGSVRFLSDAKGPDGTPVYTDAAGAAAELATSRPHWVKARLTPGTGAGGAGAGAAPPASTISYAELLKPGNSDKLRDYIANKPEALARLRQAHFER